MKIAILGTENSHALAFARLIKNDPDFREHEVIGIYGYDAEANRAILEEGLAPRAGETHDAFLNEAEGILVTARHGDHHEEYALPYVKKGIPAFIDKPFCVSLDKAHELIEAAKANGACLCGGSSLKHLKEAQLLAEYAAAHKVTGGTVAAPIHMVNPYGGYYFYAQHLVEILLRIFGKDVRAVQAFCPDETRDRITVRFDYGDWDVTGLYSESHVYSASVFSKDGTQSCVASDVTYCYKLELSEFFRMAETHVMPQDWDELLLPLRIQHAAELSWRTGKPLNLSDIL